MVTITCNNKGCGKLTFDSLLDEKSNEIICCECGKAITNTSEFTKRALKGMGKLLKKESKSAFVVECRECNKKAQPIINEKKEIVCFHCSKPLNLSAPFKKMFLEYIANRTEEQKKAEEENALQDAKP